MDKVKEAWGKLVGPWDGAQGYDEDVQHARELMLAVHYDKCESFVMETGKATLECGTDGWDCPKAKALKELGGKA